MLVASVSAHAGEPRLLGSYGDWAAYVFMEEGNKVCYMASKPTNAEGDYTKRGEVYALLTHRPAEGTKNVFSYITGYDYKPGSDATIQIDDQKYVLFTQDDTAWAPDASTDEKLAEAIQKGSKMEVRGTSSRGTQTMDNFSLKGSSKAYERISDECRV
jgi:invasion protein IalB